MLTVIACVVAPLLHKYAAPVLAVKVAVCPCVITIFPLGAMVAVGAGFTVTATGEETLLHVPLLTVTEYVPDALTVIDCDKEPLLHRYDEPALDVNTTLPPWQNEVAPLVLMVAEGNAFTATTLGDDVAVHIPFVTVTKYEPAVLTVMDGVVAPVLHW